MRVRSAADGASGPSSGPAPGGSARPALRMQSRLRSSDTRLGRLFFPGMVFLAATYVTFIVCDTLAAQSSWLASSLRTRSGGAGSTLAFSRTDVGSQVGGGAGGVLTTPVREEKEKEVVAGVAKSSSTPILVVFTSNGSPYLNWQTRIMYATFVQVQAQPEGKHMKYFTRYVREATQGCEEGPDGPAQRGLLVVPLFAHERSHAKRFLLECRLLHRRTDDELMGEVPTVRVDSLHAACDKCACNLWPPGAPSTSNA